MSAKRRAGHAASPDFSTPDPAKRRKRNDDTYFPDVENVETTQEIGLKMMRLLYKSKDKNGRDIATHFLQLPDQQMHPDYYIHVKMPLSLHEIQQRLDDGEYDNLEKFEADLKRMIQNAKDYNATKSEIFEDAERLRKAMSNFMPKHNPAYTDPNYRAYPTAIPQEMLDRVSTPVSAIVNGNSEKVKLVLTNNRASTGGRRQSRAVSTPQAPEDPREDLVAAQLKLLDELSDQPDAINFEEKPPRNIPGYYKLIKEPTSISDVRSALDEGQFANWDDFASAVRLIWSNAKTFNEDASEIYQMAETLEQWFDKHIERAGGPGPRSIKLNISQPAAPPKLILSLGRRGTSAASGGPDDTSSVQKHEAADSTRTRPSTVDAGTPIPPTLKRSGSAVGSQSSMQDIRTLSHQSTADLPKSQLSNQTTTPAMNQPLAAMTNVLQSRPQPLNVQMPNGTYPTETIQAPKPVNLFAESDNPIERRYRDPGKGISDAILGSVTFMTHPDLHKNPRWKLERYASDTMTQTSSFAYLPSTHYYLRVIPRPTIECKSRLKHKITVCRNWEQMSPAPGAPGAYDFRIHPGENIIAIDAIASLAEGDSKPYAPPQLQLDFERITFTIVLRAPTPN